ncbi:type IV pilin protein [Gynuella sunshinyii]|uniref:Tfp pilus assembly protein PilE n=1 Tax=Gynuella sunshinyii YC6258 TaxID=1445510 RepID=A0A0C5W3E5_9GAMM|nr:type IV pilin protein [Gynuella sunshinyii]AJQ97159.1 tfp pilus assembly protein PilE [Gynuella sunshinyii YC6258]
MNEVKAVISDIGNAGYEDRLSGKKNWIKGFTLIEVLVVIAIVAILATIAIPSYSRYIQKSRAKAAAADLVAISLVMENMYQRQLKYLKPADVSATPALSNPTSGTLETLAYLGNGDSSKSAWKPAEGDYFSYTVKVTDTAGGGYLLTAKGVTGTSSAGCELTIKNDNTRSANGNSGCGGFSSW